MEEEIWKHVDGLPAGYEISSLGNMRIDYTDHVEPIELHETKAGIVAYIFGTTYKIHRLVAATFIPNPENKKLVFHVDGDIKNNCASNLVWTSRVEASHNAVKSGKMNGIRVYCETNGKTYATISTASACTGIPICAIEYGLDHGEPMFGFQFKRAVDTNVIEENVIMMSKSDIINLGRTNKSVDVLKTI